MKETKHSKQKAIETNMQFLSRFYLDSLCSPIVSEPCIKLIVC